MKKTLGILGALLVVIVLTSLSKPAEFLSAYNVYNILQRYSLDLQ